MLRLKVEESIKREGTEGQEEISPDTEMIMQERLSKIERENEDHRGKFLGLNARFQELRVQLNAKNVEFAQKEEDLKRVREQLVQRSF